MEGTVVFYCYSSAGHITPVVQLGKILASHGFAVAVLFAPMPWDSPASAEVTDTFAAANPGITFHRLPPASPPSIHEVTGPLLAFHIIRKMNPHILRFINSASNVVALIADMFCTDAFEVAAHVGIPAYLYYPSCASSLSAFLRVPDFKGSTVDVLRDTLVDVPGLPQPVTGSDIISFMLESNETLAAYIHHFERYPKTNGIITNTVEVLEKRALKALTEMRVPLPPIYAVGPLVSHGDEKYGYACISWLDSQPAGSVVLLAFGSMGPPFPREQFRDIAVGLERSEQRFIWVLKSPHSFDPEKPLVLGTEEGLGTLLPEGFLERTHHRGLVITSWAPQPAILRHKAVGGFVTHCGWNSTLEAVSAGVPLIAWPLYAEQRVNKAFLVDEAKLAVEMNCQENGIVDAEEVEAKIRWHMQSDGGKEMRARALTVKDGIDAATKQGGSSKRNSQGLVDAFKNFHHTKTSI